MGQLLLLRHAKSSWDDPGLSDHSRPLNRRGRLAALALREAIVGLGLKPELVLVSTSRRTLQTLQALEPWETPPVVEPQDGLYLASAGAILDAIHAVPPGTQSILVVGHNPGLHELAFQLAGSPDAAAEHADARRLADAYPSGALAEFAWPGAWADAPAGVRLVRFICPRDLPEPAEAT